ncbi:MAG: T9SS type A sorting domain-containing protein [Chitinophagaceae bacterium]|nr:T9SS type A sorting domain-containing protein [Chitinophagaceae bacterium]
MVTIEYKPAADMLVKSFSIYTVMGIKIFTGELSKATNTFNFSQLTSGIYIVRIGEGNNTYTTKIFKQ